MEGLILKQFFPEKGLVCVDWIRLAEDVLKLSADANKVMNIQVKRKVDVFICVC
jgi:hypothetical protein